ncbi:MAG: RNA 2'-phosphotransferase [Pseudomonadota bacterium]
MPANLKSSSKFMSLVLRHKPEEIGIELDENGWARIDDLVERSNGTLTDDLVRRVVETSDKKRFAISPDGQFVRANQGHSIAVDLEFVATEPPEALFHGTASRFVEQIRKEGLKPMSRQYVHLSSDEETATAVGTRHGKPHIFLIEARAMSEAGYEFFLSENVVWLTKHVPPKFLK